MEKSEDMITIINQNFVIRITRNGTRRLIGAGQLHKVIGQELTETLFSKALDNNTSKYTRKLRRGIKLEFCAK